jgi:hypothetical protein
MLKTKSYTGWSIAQPYFDKDGKFYSDKVQDEHKRTLHFKIIQKTNAAIELHSYTSRYKTQSFVHTSQRLDMCSASHTADVETIIQLVPNFVQCVPSDECKCTLSARISCTRRKWILGWVVPCEIVCEMHVAQLKQTLSSLTAENTNTSVVEQPFPN